MQTMNLVTIRSPNFGSGSTSLRLTSPLRGMRVEPLTVDRRQRDDVPPSPRHASSYFGRFAPYFERLCFRSCTPIESSVPRTMW